MFKISISDREIHQEAANSTTYNRGINYYNSNRVRIVGIDTDEMVMKAQVMGSQRYDVDIDFFEEGTVANYSCTCPAYLEYDGACKHIIAVLKAAQQGVGVKGNGGIINNNKAIANKISNFVFNYFDSIQSDSSIRELKLEVVYVFESGYGGSNSSLELRIGEDRLYVVRSIKDFLQNIVEHKVKEFGKNFSYNPKIHRFTEVDKQIIDLLVELYENENTAVKMSPFSYNQYSIFKGNKVFLSDASLKRLLGILKDREFNGRLFNRDILNIQILDEDLPISFNLSQKEEELVLDFDREAGMPIPITEGGTYFFYKDKIYNPSEKQLKYFTPFYHVYVLNKEKEIVFSGNDKERFVSEVLPYFKGVGELLVDKQLEDAFYKEELNIRAYFDKSGDEISARLEFRYGEEIIDPFNPKRDENHGKRILIRDMEKEKKVIGLIEKSEFKMLKDRVYLENEEDIFKFLFEMLPQFQEVAEVYYSDSFKRMTLRDTRHIRGKVRLNDKTDLLEISFELQDVDNEELRSIFSSIKEKRKYYRLKDGSFMPLDNLELVEMADMIESLDIKDKDLKNKIIELPKYRALYLDNKLRGSNLTHIDKNIAFKQMVQNIREPKDMEFGVPNELEGIMRDYQKIGFKWLKTLSAYGMGGILADDMGLGKTLQAISFVLSEKENRKAPVLVVSPTSLVYNWQAEVEKFAPQLKVLIISGAQKDRQELLTEVIDADIVITSYPLIRRDIDLYKNMEFSYCFLDEAQYIKNPDSINAKSVKQIKAKGYFALTGTPIENSLTELWSIFDFIMPGYLLSHSKFVKKYETPIIKNKDEKALKDLSKHIDAFILRRMKKDVLKELPEKIESSMTAELTDDQKKIYLAYLQQAKGEVQKEIEEKGFEKSQIKILSILTRLRQICCHPSLFIEDYKGDSGKMLLLQEIMGEALDGGHRILLFSQFTSMLEIIRVYLEKENIEYLYLDGSTKMEHRGELVKSFNKGKAKVFLISLKAGGTGLNLTGADTVIHFDPWWNPAVEDQASDRAYRIGQENTVQVIKLITRGTIEEKVYELQKKKKEMIESVIQPGENPLTKMTGEDLKSLFDL